MNLPGLSAPNFCPTLTEADVDMARGIMNASETMLSTIA